jgi:hypothetical protein
MLLVGFCSKMTQVPFGKQRHIRYQEANRPWAANLGVLYLSLLFTGHDVFLLTARTNAWLSKSKFCDVTLLSFQSFCKDCNQTDCQETEIKQIVKKERYEIKNFKKIQIRVQTCMFFKIGPQNTSEICDSVDRQIRKAHFLGH